MPSASDADIAAAIEEVLADGATFTLAELSEALNERGLELGETPLARVDEVMRRSEDRVLQQLAEVYNLHQDEAEALGRFLGQYLHDAALLQDGAEVPELAPDESWLAQLGLFAPPAVAEAAQLELFAAWDDTKLAPVDFLERVLAVAPAGSRANLRWLQGKAHERMSQTLAAEEAFLQAESLDPDCWLALFDLARYASDRGDAARALTLLRRAGVPAEDPHVRVLQSFQTPERKLGRNDPCWCGSGRKFKACHQGKEQLPLTQRAPWLFHKASVYLNQEDWQAQALDLASLLAGPEATEEEISELSWSPMVLSSLMFEDRALESFLTERGMLLPADEQALVRSWLEVPRSVYRVQSTASQHITVRDLASGSDLEVWDPHAAQLLPPGFVLCARWLPVEDNFIGFGGYEPLHDAEVDEFLEALQAIDHAAEWLTFVAARREEEAHG